MNAVENLLSTLLLDQDVQGWDAPNRVYTLNDADDPWLALIGESYDDPTSTLIATLPKWTGAYGVVLSCEAWEAKPFDEVADRITADVAAMLNLPPDQARTQAAVAWQDCTRNVAPRSLLPELRNEVRFAIAVTREGELCLEHVRGATQTREATVVNIMRQMRRVCSLAWSES